ncbi:unnamed protein product [Spodoptera littoralis]|uniref:Uncharacterized protein n=1 Tax=Spodoptera littoralis TaxID=7109 RepID=A0A9P0IGQ5_SPOLI|nr:unnamed protein product [Spodoptera littoralis]
MEEILEKCHFVPMSTMKKVIDFIESPMMFDPIKIYCKRNLLKLQQSRNNSKYQDKDLKTFKSVHRIACCKAIYSHNWNKLLYLLKKCPPWEHNWKDVNEAALYTRALVILIMYHPTSQALGLLNEYLHLVWSCRSDEVKKAVLKILLTLPEKIHGVTNSRYKDTDKE